MEKKLIKILNLLEDISDDDLYEIKYGTNGWSILKNYNEDFNGSLDEVVARLEEIKIELQEKNEECTHDVTSPTGNCAGCGESVDRDYC